MTRWGNPKTLMQDAAHQVDAARYISLRFLCCLIASRASKMHKLKTLPNTDTSNGFFSLKNSIAKTSVCFQMCCPVGTSMSSTGAKCQVKPGRVSCWKSGDTKIKLCNGKCPPASVLWSTDLISQISIFTNSVCTKLIGFWQKDMNKKTKTKKRLWCQWC